MFSPNNAIAEIFRRMVSQLSEVKNPTVGQRRARSMWFAAEQDIPPPPVGASDRRGGGLGQTPLGVVEVTVLLGYTGPRPRVVKGSPPNITTSRTGVPLSLTSGRGTFMSACPLDALAETGALS